MAEQETTRDILICASDEEVNALAELIDLGVKTGGYKVARNAGFWVQRLEEAVAARNARRDLPLSGLIGGEGGTRPIPIWKSGLEESADGAA